MVDKDKSMSILKEHNSEVMQKWKKAFDGKEFRLPHAEPDEEEDFLLELKESTYAALSNEEKQIVDAKFKNSQEDILRITLKISSRIRAHNLNKN